MIKALESKYKLFTPLDIGSTQRIMRRCVYRGWLAKAVYGGQHKYSLTDKGRAIALVLKKITAPAANEKTQLKGEQEENGY